MRHAWPAGGVALLAVCTLGASGPRVPVPTGADESFSFGRFGPIAVYLPKGAPEQVVLFISGDGGWSLGVIPMAQRLQALGALVAGIDIRRFVHGLQGSSQSCAYPAGDLEELSRTVQLRHHLPAYKRPILVGYSSGATLVYAALAAAPPETFAGAISLGFCPDLEITKPPCRARGLGYVKRAKGVGYDLGPARGLSVPWMVLQGDIDQVCAPEGTRAFVAQVPGGRLFWLPKVGHGFSVMHNWEDAYLDAYGQLASRPSETARSSIPAVQDLPLVEVPAAASAPARDLMAVIVTGDGGWAEIDKGIADGLAGSGVPVVGWSSLRYFWKPRTPDGAAADLARVLDHYLAAWHKRRALLVGYSFGADVLPFMVNRLPAPTLARVAEVALLGLSPHANFEFHVSNWLGAGGESRFPTAPEVERLPVTVTCLYGTDETDTACAPLQGPHIRRVVLPGGHHFGGRYDLLAAKVLEPLAGH